MPGRRIKEAATFRTVMHCGIIFNGLTVLAPDFSMFDVKLV